MAEVAAASSIGGLLSLTIQVIQISQRYVTGVKNASKTIKGYFRELNIMRLVLADCEMILKEREPGLSIDPCFLDSCSEELDRLRSRLSKRSSQNNVTAALNRLTWPFAEDETRRLIDVLHRYQSSMHALLSAENLRLTAATLTAIDQVKARQEQDVKERMVKWLSNADPLVNHLGARDKHEPCTGRWFLDSPEFTRWKSIPGEYLWIRSIPGAGKTILCSTIIDYLIRNQKGDEFILYYYFDFRDERKQRLEALLRSLIAQFCVRADDVPAEVQRAFETGAGLDTRSLAQIFLSLADASGSVKIILDAVDESSERSPVLKFLQDLSQQMAGTVQWLVTSRNQQSIEDVLGRCATAIVSLSERFVDADIRLHVDACLLRDPTLRLRPSWIKQRISDVLVSKARGMFQWVECQLVALRRCLTAPAIEAALVDLPAGIDETYDRILESIERENWEYIRRALVFLNYSLRPMSVEEVAEAAITVPSCKPFDPGDRFFDPKDIIRLAAGLVVCDETTGILTLAHYSVQEYLLSARIMQSSTSYFSLEERLSNRALASICMTYMISVAELTVGHNRITHDFPLLEYASEYWLDHALDELSDPKSGVFQLMLHICDGSKGAHCFWLTYYDHERRNQSPIRSLLSVMPDESLLILLRQRRFRELPCNLLIHELCEFIVTYLRKNGYTQIDGIRKQVFVELLSSLSAVAGSVLKQLKLLMISFLFVNHPVVFSSELPAFLDSMTLLFFAPDRFDCMKKRVMDDLAKLPELWFLVHKGANPTLGVIAKLDSGSQRREEELAYHLEIGEEQMFKLFNMRLSYVIRGGDWTDRRARLQEK